MKFVDLNALKIFKIKIEEKMVKITDDNTSINDTWSAKKINDTINSAKIVLDDTSDATDKTLSSKKINELINEIDSRQDITDLSTSVNQFIDTNNTNLDGKIDKPKTNGEESQVLSLNAEGNTVWKSLEEVQIEIDYATNDDIDLLF